MKHLKAFKIWLKQTLCKHKEWNSDKQIRTIECINCKKRAWVKDYINLY